MSFRKISSFVGILLLFSCSDAKLLVESEPNQAQVVLIGPKKAPIELGQTPLTVDFDEVSEAKGDLINLKVIKDGYESESVLLTKSLLPTKGTLSFTLDREVQNVECSLNQAKVRRLSRGIAMAQFMISSKDFVQAEITLNSLIVDFPSNSVLYDLLGNVHYIRKDYARAQNQYEKSLAIDPDNADTKRMVDLLGGMRNPAGSAR